jgi:hypothetical protein
MSGFFTLEFVSIHQLPEFSHFRCLARNLPGNETENYPDLRIGREGDEAMISKLSVAASAAILGLSMMFAASARADLITNGSFETLTNGAGQLGFNTDAVGWTTSGYNFVYNSGTADNGGTSGVFGNLQLWGPGNGSANGLPASSPDGGNYIAADGAFQTGPISQTISGLIIGQQYTVEFYWAGAQQYTFDGNTTEQWIVSLGSQSIATDVLNDANHGFTGWQHVAMTFTADGVEDVLSFLAVGTPNGEPPFALLDGVTMNVPEPASMTLMGAGLAALGLVRRRRSVR